MTSRILFLKETLSRLVPLARMTDESLGKLNELLSRDAPGGVEEIVTRVSGGLDLSEDAALLLFRALNYVASEGADAGMDAAGLLDELLFAVQRSNLDEQPKKDLSALLKRRPTPLLPLFDPYGRWRTVQKKYDLLKGLVNSVEAVRTICDLRPIFDERRENIVDSGVTFTIEFLVINREGRAQQVVVTASPAMLDTIVKKLTLAQRKATSVLTTFSTGGKN